MANKLFIKILENVAVKRFEKNAFKDLHAELTNSNSSTL